MNTGQQVIQPTSLGSSPPDPVQERLETLLFKATNPTNRGPDVNTIKQFCDTVNMSTDGALLAARMLGHRIQSPQDQEALQALAVLEAAVKSCGQVFHCEVGKFRFLNELIKLVSPKYLGTRTPDHVKLKVVELLFSWTKEIPGERKIAEAYEMLKAQGVVTSDPDYLMGSAVFVTSLPPRQEVVLDQEQTRKLQNLLHSKKPEDIEEANRIIKGMVKKDEEKMEKLTKRLGVLQSVTSNVKLLNEMLDNYKSAETNNSEERELMADLGSACEKLRPGLYRMASELEDGDEAIGEILATSDDLTRVIDRYRDVIVLGKPDTKLPVKRPVQTQVKDMAEDLVDRTDSLLDFCSNSSTVSSLPTTNQQLNSANLSELDSLLVRKDILSESPLKVKPAIAVASTLNLLSDFSPVEEQNCTPVAPPVLSLVETDVVNVLPLKSMSVEEPRKRKGLDELDVLGECLMKENLPDDVVTSFDARRNEKLPLNMLKKAPEILESFEIKDLTNELKPISNVHENSSPDYELNVEQSISDSTVNGTKNIIESKSLTNTVIETNLKVDVKFNDIDIDMSKIKPALALPPQTLQEGAEKGLTVVLNFTTNRPMDGAVVLVATFTNHQQARVTNLEFRAVVPRGCKVKTMPPSDTCLPPFNPFTPPPAATQVIIIGASGKTPVSLSYVLTYEIEEEQVTDMGKDILLPDALWESVQHFV